MRIEIELVEKIDRYLSDAFNEVELSHFEKELAGSQDLKILVEDQKISNLIVVGNRLNSVKNLMTEDFFESTSSSNFFSNYKWWIAVSTIAIGGFVYLYLSKEKQVQNPKIKQNEIKSILLPDSVTTIIQDRKGEKFVATSKINNEHKDIIVLTEEPVNLSENAFITNKSKEEKVAFVELKENQKPEPSVKNEIQKIPDTVAENTNTVKEDIALIETKIEKLKTISFKPEFGETAQIPLLENASVKLSISNRAGILIWTDSVVGENMYIWDGKNNQGGISSPGLYNYILEYSAGTKVFGQLIIY